MRFPLFCVFALCLSACPSPVTETVTEDHAATDPETHSDVPCVDTVPEDGLDECADPVVSEQPKHVETIDPATGTTQEVVVEQQSQPRNSGGAVTIEK